MFVLFLGIAFAGKSQTSNDTMCFPIKAIQNLLIAAKQKAILSKDIVKLKSDISLYEVAVTEYKATVKAQERKDSAQVRIIEEQYQQRLIYTQEVNTLNRKLNRARIGTKFVAGAGILALVALLVIVK